MPVGDPIVYSSQRDRQLAPLLHCGFLLVGVVHTLLGPILPMLAARWRLDDAEAGSLFIAQFTGAMIGSCAIEPDGRTVGIIAPDGLRLCGDGRGRRLSGRQLLGDWSPVGSQLRFRDWFDCSRDKSPGCGDQFGTSRGGAQYLELRVGAGRGRRPAADRPVRARRTFGSTVNWTGGAAVRYCLVDCASLSYGFIVRTEFTQTEPERSGAL